jgi:hypothetical protein
MSPAVDMCWLVFPKQGFSTPFSLHAFNPAFGLIKQVVLVIDVRCISLDHELGHSKYELYAYSLYRMLHKAAKSYHRY